MAADQEQKDGKTLYRTSDLYFAAFLASIDVKMVTTEEEFLHNRKKVYFVFSVKKGEFRRLKAEFFGGSAKVRAKRYADMIRSLKQLCHT